MVSAYWLGNDTGLSLETWLAHHRTSALPPRPRRSDDAFSPHGGGGRGIHWFEANQTVFGYIDGWDFGYAIPFTAVIEERSAARHGVPEEIVITVHSDEELTGVPPVHISELADQPTGHECDQHVGFEQYDAAM
jgi:hypothetical protein